MKAKGDRIAYGYRLKPRRWIKIIFTRLVNNPDHAIPCVFFYKLIKTTQRNILVGKLS